MITPAQLYDATEGGLQIIELHYPDARKAALRNEPFKARPDERTPSARLKQFSSQGVPIWKMTDFGGEGRAIDPIQIHMEAKGIGFTEAIADLSVIFNITDNLNRSVNRPDVRKQPVREDQPDGSCSWEIDQEFTTSECAVMGPRVTPEHLKALNWHRVKCIVSVKNREATYKFSNEHYPIFMRECWFTDTKGNRDCFYKIYEPLNVEKQYRFQYQPRGKKPQSYINGLSELIAAYTAMNEREEKLFFSDPSNENKPYKEKKLQEAVICSGERDAICVKALGYSPLWFNSETYHVSVEEWKLITKYVEVVYNIPDIDATGRRKGTELALRFIDVHTIWLPEKLSQYRDNRGNPRKDFRDWAEIWKDNGDFRNLLTLATPARFWMTRYNEKTGAMKLSIDVSCLHEFLMLNGFHTLRDKNAPSTRFVRVTGNIVEEVTPKEIRDFVCKWTIETAQPRELRNLVLTTPMLSANALESLKEIDPDFTNFTPKSQTFYFPKFSVEVTGNEFIRHENNIAKLGRYVWKENIIDHDIKIGPDMFEITHPEGMNSSEDFDIVISGNQSNFFKYLINSSRIYWRKELEQSLAQYAPDDAARYRAEHKFDIAGPLLSPEEIQEQKQCLISKIFTIGFMLHRYKSMSRAWAPFAMDNIIGENDQCNGGSGKSFMFTTLFKFAKGLMLDGRNPKMRENSFMFEQVTKSTDVVLFDDCSQNVDIQDFYTAITQDLTVNAKNTKSYNIKFEDAPKFAFTTNFVPREFSGSTRRRMLFVVFSDYYHAVSEDNDYKETRTIRDDFDKNLFGDDYTETEWEGDINFIMQCVKFYLSVSHLPIKIEPMIGNIIYRKYMHDMSENFKDWAYGYFSPESGNLDTEIVREKAFDDYKRFSGVTKITMQKFSKSLRGFCYTCDYIDSLNPEDLHNSGSRIMRRIEDPITHQRVQKEMIYLRTKREAERIADPEAQPPEQLDMPF